MPMVPKNLADALASDFDSLNDDDSGDNQPFVDAISDETEKYVKNAVVVTMDKGNISAGVFVGAGNGKIDLKGKDMADALKPIVDSMNDMTEGGDDTLASGIASSFAAMMGKAKVQTDVKGTATNQSSGATSAVSGKAEGTITVVPSPLESALKAAFKNMADMTENGNQFFAEQYATAVTNVVKAGVVLTQGKAALAGAIGNGTSIS